MFVQMISGGKKLPKTVLPNLVLWCIIMQELIWSKYDNVYCIFWTADHFATKLGLIERYHKPECFMEKLDCCVQGQGHSKISKCQCLSRSYFLHHWTFLQPNLVWWCIIMRQCVLQKKWFTILHCQGQDEGLYNQDMTIFTISSKLLVQLQPNFVLYYSNISLSVLWKMGLLHSRSQRRF